MFASMAGDLFGGAIIFMAMLLLLAGKVVKHVDQDGTGQEAVREGIIQKILTWLKG